MPPLMGDDDDDDDARTMYCSNDVGMAPPSPWTIIIIIIIPFTARMDDALDFVD